MSESEQLEIDSPQESAANKATDSVWAVSLAFWFLLLIASMAYGAVALAPKFSEWLQVRTQYLRNAHQLIALEKDVDYLERVYDALEKDPQFVSRLMEARQNDQHGDGEAIPVSGDLMFSSMRAPQLVTKPQPEGRLESAATFLATDRTTRQALVWFAAGLTIFGFTFLNDSGQGLVRSSIRLSRTLLMAPQRRYLKPDEGMTTEEIAENEV